MKLGVFLSDLRGAESIVGRLKAEKLGVIFVGNGIYHAILKENGKPSSILQTEGAEFFVLSEDLETRGFSADDADNNVSVINFDKLADLVMNDYDKLAWL